MKHLSNSTNQMNSPNFKTIIGKTGMRNLNPSSNMSSKYLEHSGNVPWSEFIIFSECLLYRNDDIKMPEKVRDLDLKLDVVLMTLPGRSKWDCLGRVSLSLPALYLHAVSEKNYQMKG